MKNKYVFLAFMLLLVGVQMSATDFYVRKTGSDVVNNGLSWNSAFASIDKAIKTSTNGDRIYIAGDTLCLSSTIIIDKNLSIYGGYVLSNVGGQTLGQQRTKAEGKYWDFDTPTRITVPSGTEFRLFQLSGNVVVSFDGIIFDGGKAVTSLTGSSSGCHGGAILAIEGSVLSISRCQFLNNRSEKRNTNSSNGFGGAIYSEVSTNISQCYFRNNSAMNGSSGGGAVSLNLPKGKTALIDLSTFEGNSSNVNAGAARICGLGTIKISRSVFINNLVHTYQYADGAAIVLGTSNVTSTAVVENTLFAHNTAVSGAVTAYGGTFKNNTFVNNEGAFLVKRDSTFIYNSMFFSIGSSYVINTSLAKKAIIQNCGVPQTFDSTYVNIKNNTLILSNSSQLAYGPFFKSPSDVVGSSLSVVNTVLTNDTVKYKKILSADWSLNHNSQFINLGDKSYLPIGTDLLGNTRSPLATTAIGAYEYIPYIPASTDLYSTTWRSALYPENWEPGYKDEQGRGVQDFSHAGYHTGIVELPVITKNVVDITASPWKADNTGNTDVTSIIQNAINSLPDDGGVVYFPAGEYKISIQGSNSFCLNINKSNVVLRGAGAGISKIKNTTNDMRHKNLLFVNKSGGDWQQHMTDYTSVIRDLEVGDIKIPVQSTSAYKVGDWVVLTNDVTTDLLKEWYADSLWTTNMRRNVYCRQITAKEGNTITLDLPIRMPMKVRDNVRIGKMKNQLTEIGLEDLSFGNIQTNNIVKNEEWDYGTEGTVGYVADKSYLIQFKNCINCWVKNVSSYRPDENSGPYHSLSNALHLFDCRFITVLNCNFQYPQYRGGNGNGYMYTLESNDCLIKDCSAAYGRHNYSHLNMTANGCVITNCISKSPSLISDYHMMLSHGNLIDGFMADGDSFTAAFDPNGAGDYVHGYNATENLIWNFKSIKAYNVYKFRPQGVRSTQLGTGYVIGTSGIASSVLSLPTIEVVLNPVSERFLFKSGPEDWVEGVLYGERLVPQLLYNDQLTRRIKSITNVLNPVSSQTDKSLSIRQISQSELEYNLKSQSNVLQIHTIAGQLLRSINLNELEGIVDITFLQTGVYLASLISNNNNVESIKLIRY